MTELVLQGFNLTLFGMGTVVIFLSLLIIVTKFMSAIVLRFEASTCDTALKSESTERKSDEQTIQEVIAKAIKQYRLRRG